MHHLDIVSGTILSYPVAAWLLANLGGNSLEDGLDVWPGIRVATRHEGGAIACPILSPTHSTADEEETFLCQRFGTALCMGVWVRERWHISILLSNGQPKRVKVQFSRIVYMNHIQRF